MKRFPMILAGWMVFGLGHLVPAAEPTVAYADGVKEITPAAKDALIQVLKAAKVSGCRISSTTRTSAEQAQAMHDYITRHGVEAAKKMYGSEGDKVVEVYVALSNGGAERAQVVAGMTAKVVEVLPVAREKRQMMHVDRPEFDVFDVAESSIPSQLREGFVKAARASTRFHRFLGPAEGEKDCYHFEFPKAK